MGVMDFGEAIKALKRGEHVTRAGWNGKGMWLVLIRPGNAIHTSAAGRFAMQPCIGLKTVDDKMSPGWLASQTDMLAEDWEIIDAAKVEAEIDRVPLPSVGRIVHYYGTLKVTGRDYPPVLESRPPYAALVVDVGPGPRTVTLKITDHQGVDHVRANVAYGDPGWMWPPRVG